MTYQVDIIEAQRRFLDLIQAAENGEEVIITRDQQPLIRLCQDSLPYRKNERAVK